MEFDATATDTLQKARLAGLKIATAESCTGGLIAAALTEIPGSSDVMDRGFITYSNAAKTDMLGVRVDTLDAVGAVSEEVAREMAEGALAKAVVDLAISVTGIAGPGGSGHKPEGRVCFGLARTNQTTHTETVEFGAIGRAHVRAKTVHHALALILKSLDS